MSTKSDSEALPVLIIGGGLSGLACARRLQEKGVPFRLFEASDRVGGRVQTDVFEGYLLDRGFQVYLDAYPETAKLLHIEALQLKPFEPGALVFTGRNLECMMDVFRRPAYCLKSVLASVGTLSDKLRVGRLRFQLLNKSDDEIAAGDDISTEAYLRQYGFSEGMIDAFFRSFYGGIFLERELRTSSRMFEFTFKLFSRGSATLPAGGMGEIPKQIVKKLPADTVQLNSMVTALDANGVTLQGGGRIEGRAAVVATDLSEADTLLSGAIQPRPGWRSVTNIYYATDESPTKGALIALNGTNQGLVNNVCVLSDAAPAYAPNGMALVSVSVLGAHDDSHIFKTVQQELESWFGDKVTEWRHLRTYVISRALPEQLPNAPHLTAGAGFSFRNGVWTCGDHTSSASIEGAVISGTKTADAVIRSFL